jgi:hypothetical protein
MEKEAEGECESTVSLVRSTPGIPQPTETRQQQLRLFR